ncbi:hypothetical protein GYA49_01885 [Candidatus Beckwithbacteria bacterium]|nr:hypothetical protein [Candidatus Beckwithbacteria bacterium]
MKIDQSNPIGSQNLKPSKHKGMSLPVALIVLFFILCGIVALYIALPVLTNKINISQLLPTGSSNNIAKLEKPSMKQFASKEEFTNYLQQQSQSVSATYGTDQIAIRDTMEMAPTSEMGSLNTAPKAVGSGLTRVSQTNVQVLGIDEPDIVKTNGEQIYFSSEMPVYRVFSQGVETMPMIGRTESVSPKYQATNQTKVINAFPPADLAQIGQIDKNGQMLLDDKTLLVLGNDNQIYAYDISDPKQPKQTWNYKLADNTQLDTARLYDGMVYLITKTYVSFDNPCPLKPLTGTQTVKIACTDIYYPTIDTEIDTTYTIIGLKPENGDIANKISFVGSSNSSVVYMSADSIVVSYSYSGDMAAFMQQFFTENGKDFISQSAQDRINKLASYELSKEAKLVELTQIINDYKATLTSDDRLKFENELNNRMSDFVKAHMREMSQTELTKISVPKLEIAATGAVSGQPLNQFSLDEYEGNIRIATTVNPVSYFGFGSFQGGRSEGNANDVYVLDKNLKTIGSITDLGLDERIYSARFIGEKAYLVTFRQTDPFYILDLSNPRSPKMTGELKIPGYSSYLHPLTDTMILGVGEESNQVKLSLFDVSDDSNPVELDKYLLDEYWSEVSNNHHAFLQDEKHQVFYIPASKGAYIFSYQGNKLELTKAVEQQQSKRAVFLDDYLYLIGEQNLIVVNESDWQQVNELKYEDNPISDIYEKESPPLQSDLDNAPSNVLPQIDSVQVR